MRDYTKYNFDAIVGAEVSVDHDDTYTTGVLVADTPEKIYIHIDIYNYVSKVEEVRKDKISSLSAMLRPRKMTLEQVDTLKIIVANEKKEKVDYMVNPLFGINIFNGKREGDKSKVDIWFHWCEYIDCTEWGWKHE